LKNGVTNKTEKKSAPIELGTAVMHDQAPIKKNLSKETFRTMQGWVIEIGQMTGSKERLQPGDD